ncbi:MAG: LUD domain-containing protein [Deltaproteobacteria bacterium]|nr:LUD domain-containing protein [Deltaproteobacteria bacterium]
MSINPELLEEFMRKAQAVSVIVTEAASASAALEYTMDVCRRKDACQLLLSGCEAPLSKGSEDLCAEKQGKIVAAPKLDPAWTEQLTVMGQTQGVRVITHGLRDHLAGIDIGLTMADYGVSETGTLVIDSSDEDLRLATMISEIHVAILPASRIRKTLIELETELNGLIGQMPGFTAFITGASRTADIERVLALGVHGPLELHVLIWKDK